MFLCKAILRKIDQDPLQVPTEALRRFTERSDLATADSIFLEDDVPTLSHSERRQCLGFLLRRFDQDFPSRIITVLDRAMRYNGDRLVPAHDMIQAWISKGCPATFFWKGPGAKCHKKHSMIRESDLGRGNDEQEQEKEDLVSVAIESERVMEMVQYLHLREKMRKEDANGNQKSSSSKSNIPRPKPRAIPKSQKK